MRFTVLSTIAALAAVAPTAAFSIDQWDVLAGKALINQVLYHFSNPDASRTCTPLTATVRREWGSLSKWERKEYTDAVNCLASKPSKLAQSDPAFAPGARSRYDDFVAVHINQTWFIHATGNFLTWHRYFTWAYEQALRNECGYTGYQPYWAWNKYADDPRSSPVFDGSDYSMSGDGSYIPHNGTEAAPGIVLTPGNGGGCVFSGPFKNWTVNLGPVFPSLKVPGIVAQNGSGLNYNPRCLRRDICKDAASWTTTDQVVDLINNYTDILSFQNRMQGDFPNGFLGIHSGGHYTIGGDPGGDFFVSPGDPAFFLHHAAIDRVFWTWQNQDPTSRTYVVAGQTVLPALDPNAPNATLDDIVNMSSALAPPQTIRQLLDTTGGPAGPVLRLDAGRNRPKTAPKATKETLSLGLSDEDLWMLIRRFNKQIYHVKAAANTASEGLDLNRAQDEQFPPEKLRITIERFYMSVVIGMVGFCSHIARLRSWKEPRRTAIFCAGYFIAWLFDVVIFTLSGLLIALVLCPPLRQVLFPGPSPASTGSENPADGEPRKQDSITGTSERHKGEAAEREAHNLVNSVATIAMKSATSKYGQAVSEDAEKVAEPESLEDVVDTADALDESVTAETQKPMKRKVASATDEIMRTMNGLTDIYEKFCNLLSPTPPFVTYVPRLRLVGIMASVCLLSLVVSSNFIIKATAFALGLGFFGDPIINYSIDYLNRKIPNWRQHLDLQKTLLKGIPTNAQLTLTLLRIGEINSSPLPPPPDTADKESSSLIRRKARAVIASNATPIKEEATDSSDTHTDQQADPAPKQRRKWIFKVLRFVRRTIETAIKSHGAFDRAMRIANSAHTRTLLELLAKKDWFAAPTGPLKFEAKFQRKRGTAVIDSNQEPPVMYFTTTQSASIDDLRLESQKKGSVLFQIPVSDITELKKTEGLGWKGKLIVELTAGSKEAADGLVISGSESEQAYHLTGMKARDQLFNRLIAIDAQFWESH
ncbi:hypothetical protein CNMCM7691_002665 [Aspergillus felis]|uniref:Tyrosinase copper-binding domain-containing protein n=1 Tax=Aspergillus felis TaxID=1287682 RepID=A0A8H6R1E0_9EURO|nr:hypothetical protein CNMCM7691_002665 [Aspergillus felis]